ncbi:hypothetical protein ATY41_00010 [Leifsonia xyli subsp. xyli]|uniref:Uncharacterized protein n=1 Tax=Leifsonia xyli subsp. xyli TaxID=59736 RepID=A0A1E2SN23_LEIXY|nr:hypothetical protein [Leifsonia xyli]ODA91131.1 hypothetical protein ATY41_00010 [Leifsonia xyli subsp. xyli]
MQRVDIVAVVGVYAPERLRYAKRLAAITGREFVPATQLAISADPVDEAATISPGIKTPAGAVFEFPHSAPVIKLIGALTDPDTETQLTGIVCVADAAHLLEDLQ